MNRRTAIASLATLATLGVGITGCSVSDPSNPTTQKSTKAKGGDPKPADKTTKPAAKKTTSMTKAQANAVAKAKLYLETLPFSEKGLIKQLEFDKFSTADATYGAKHCGADWNEQAVKKAKQYLDTMPFSESALVDQLKFDGFTDAQAKHGAKEALK